MILRFTPESTGNISASSPPITPPKSHSPDFYWVTWLPDIDWLVFSILHTLLHWDQIWLRFVGVNGGNKQIIWLQESIVVMVVVSADSGYFLSTLGNNIIQILKYIYGNLNSPPEDTLPSETVEREIRLTILLFWFVFVFLFLFKKKREDLR